MKKLDARAIRKAWRMSPLANASGTRTLGLVLIESLPSLLAVLALVIPLLLIYSIGVSPWSAITVLFGGALGTVNGLGVTALKLSPLLIAGLGVAVGVRCGLWNLGSDGQIYMGGLGATVVVLQLIPSAPGPLQIAAGLLAGFVGGALWVLIPALLKAARGVNELITTLLMNYIAMDLVATLVEGPLGLKGASYPRSPGLPASSFLPIILPGSQAHFGVIIGIVVALAIFVLFRRTSFGFEIRAVGEGQMAARIAGIAVERRIVQALLLSGGLAGLAGAVEILGLQHNLPSGFDPGYGFSAVAVAMLAGADPRWIILSAFFFATLLAGAPSMELFLSVPVSIVSFMEGLVIIAVVGGYALRSYFKRRLAIIQQEDAATSLMAAP